MEELIKMRESGLRQLIEEVWADGYRAALLTIQAKASLYSSCELDELVDRFAFKESI